MIPSKREKDLIHDEKQTRNKNEALLITQGHKVDYKSPKSSKFSEIRIAVCGNVDAGKTTLVGVLTSGQLDNGRGQARASVFNHPHEMETGRTSSVARQILGFDENGDCVNYGHTRAAEWSDIMEKSTKVVSFTDLAGHEKYLKLTVAGMTGTLPDYCFLVVGANMGISKMTKEHLGLSLSLKIPVVVIMTKIDMCPPEIRKQTRTDIADLLRSRGSQKMAKGVQTDRHLSAALAHYDSDRLVPVFEVSSVTGEGMDLLRKYLRALPPRVRWDLLWERPAEFVVDETHSITGVGTVVCGTVMEGVIQEGQKLLLGPDHQGLFKEVTVKSIQTNRVPIQQAKAGQCVGLGLKKIKKTEIHRGMVLVDPSTAPQATWTFGAEVLVLSNSTTFARGYQPIVQCLATRQCAHLVEIHEHEVLRTGERANVKFQFLYRPEYLKVGTRMVLREAHCKGLGVVTHVQGGKEGRCESKAEIRKMKKATEVV